MESLFYKVLHLQVFAIEKIYFQSFDIIVGDNSEYLLIRYSEVNFKYFN